MSVRRVSPCAVSSIGATLALCLALSALLTGCSSGSGSSSAGSAPVAAGTGAGASGFDGAALPAGTPARGFTLTDQSGRHVSLREYRGRVLILAFVYADCGPTCIVIAQQIRGALDELAQPVPVLFVSADPAADTPARVRRFLARVSLTGRVRYLSGSLAQLRPVWRAFRIVPASAGRAQFNRSASVLVLDRSGRERVLFQLEQLTPEGLAHDVRKLL
jgi:protein SCO1/2